MRKLITALAALAVGLTGAALAIAAVQLWPDGGWRSSPPPDGARYVRAVQRYRLFGQPGP